MERLILGLILVFSFLFANLVLAAEKVVVVPLSSPKPAVAAFVGGNQNFTLNANSQIVRSITLDIPDKGLVIVNANGYFNWYDSSDRQSAAVCSITQGDFIDYHYLLVGGSDRFSMTIDYLPFAGNRGFQLGKGTHTFNLVCEDSYSSDHLIRVSDTTLSAVYHYIPNIVVPAAASSVLGSANNCAEGSSSSDCN